MIPYFLLILLPMLLCFVAVEKKKNKTVLRISASYTMQRMNLAMPAFFVLLYILLALRDKTVGRDLINYEILFEGYAEGDWREYLGFEAESVYRLLNWGIGQITTHYQLFLGIIAALTILPIAILYCQDRRKSPLKILLFVNMATFVMLFSGIRQALAMGVGIVAYFAVRRKKLIQFLLLVLLAIGIHHSGIVLFALYPVYHLDLKVKHFWIIVPVFLLLFVFNQTVFSALIDAFGKYEEVYLEYEGEETGAYGSLILFVLFSLFSFVIPDEGTMDYETRGLRNLLLLATALQCFAPLHTLAMRVNYYYILFIPVILPKVLCCRKQEMRQVAVLAEIVLCAFFAVKFINDTYVAATTGVSLLDTVPYIPFWKGSVS